MICENRCARRQAPSLISEAPTLLILEQSILPELYDAIRDQSIAQLSFLASHIYIYTVYMGHVNLKIKKWGRS